MLKVLIAYTSKTGTTENAARVIAETFRLRSCEVDILQFNDVLDVKSYDGVVIGAPINGMQWHPDAVKFVTTYQQDLKKKSVAYYFMSYMLGEGRSFWNNKIQNSLNGVSNIVKPVHMGMFSGKVGDDFPAFARWIFGIKKGTASDLTNDEQVKAWAEACIEQFMNRV